MFGKRQRPAFFRAEESPRQSLSGVVSEIAGLLQVSLLFLVKRPGSGPGLLPNHDSLLFLRGALDSCSLQLVFHGPLHGLAVGRNCHFGNGDGLAIALVGFLQRILAEHLH